MSKHRTSGFTPLEITPALARPQGLGGGQFLTGFTLIEVLLVVVLVGLLAGIGVPVYQALQQRNDLDIAAAAAAQSLRRAQILAQGVDGDSQWGVRVQIGNIIIFKGTSFAARDPSYDENFEITGSIVLSGVSEVVFSKLTGNPQAMGTITLTSVNSGVRNITINNKGTVSY